MGILETIFNGIFGLAAVLIWIIILIIVIGFAVYGIVLLRKRLQKSK